MAEQAHAAGIAALYGAALFTLFRFNAETVRIVPEAGPVVL
jgi:hypothetical protein